MAGVVSGPLPVSFVCVLLLARVDDVITYIIIVLLTDISVLFIINL